MKHSRKGFQFTSAFWFGRLLAPLGALAVSAWLPLGSTTCSAEGISVRERISLDTDWRFLKEDPASDRDLLSYTNVKPWVLATGLELTKGADAAAKARPAGNPGGGTVACAEYGFNDRDWRLVNLPHDWAIEGPFKQEYPGETGKLPWWGAAWYRKHLAVPNTDHGKNIYLDVDGAMAYATVWLNGHCVGGWPYGYASWRVDLTPWLHYGADNVIAIRLDNPPTSSRWYPGGGIYRNVWLVKTAPIHVAHWGTYVTTPVVATPSATVRIQAEVDNDTDYDAKVIVNQEIFELKPNGDRGKSVASLVNNSLEITGHQSAPITNELTLNHPKLWDLAKPQRYVAVTTVLQSARVLDQYETPFGIRTTEFTVTNGFILNGRRVPIQGVCDHHDLGALGAAINTRALERQVEILKSMGCNAIRTSHNPPAPELLDICDRLGMVVMDEAFDCWQAGKNRNDYHQIYADWHENDLRALVRRDRNHPCVILWSSGNEVPDQDRADGPALANENRSIIHSEDNTRPVTAAVSSYRAGFSGFENCFDVFGWNYKPMNYTEFRERNPNVRLFGSETASCISSRGEYFFPVSTNKAEGKADFQMSSYDLYAPRWATTPDTEFTGQDKNPFVAGEFVWTGFDYLGEPTPYNGDMSNLLNFFDPVEKARAQKELETLGRVHVPSRSSYFGILDLAGFKKDRYYIYQAHWRPDFRMAHILPHWNWPERTGLVTPVHVYTSGDEAELFLNGKSLGRRHKNAFEYRLRWDDVVYQPGVLKVVAYKHGHKWATEVVKTTGPASRLTLQADRAKIADDGRDLSYVTVTVADHDGLLVPRTKNHIKFSVQGPGEIVATDNGDATSFESFQAPERNAFNGLALVIVRAKADQPGVIKLTAESDGLASATISIKSR
jgi:beta-galactosidase